MSRALRYKAPVLALSLFVATAVVLSGCSASPAPASADGEDSTEPITIAVAGLTNLHNVPLVIAQELGYFEDEGLDITLSDLQSGAKALEAVAAGSAPIAASFYDHTLRMQAKGQDYTAFVVLSTSPGAILAVPPASADEITSISDLKGEPVGVSNPGSAEDAYFSEALKQVGLTRDDVSMVSTGTGASAVAALESGQVKAGWMFEPAFSQFAERNPGTKILVDTRTKEGEAELWGEGGYAAETLYAKSSWLAENKTAATKIGSAVQSALAWMESHTATEIAEEMPADLIGDDIGFYADVLEGTMPIFTTDGKMPKDGYTANVTLLETAEGLTGLDPTATFTNEYLK